MSQGTLFEHPPLWVLGAADREMAQIETILTEAKQEFIYAYDGQGIRVTNHNAYQAALPGACKRDPNRPVVTVECNWHPRFRAVPKLRLFPISDRMYGHWVDVIDRNSLGKEFLPISSIGKVIRYLVERGFEPDWPQHAAMVSDERRPKGTLYHSHNWGWVIQTQTNERFCVIPKEHVLVAAGDMCLPLAYKGRARGVDAWQLYRYRIEQRAKHRCQDPKMLDAVLQRTIQEIKARTHDGVADLTELPDGTLPEAPEAASWLGIIVISKLFNPRNNKTRLVMLGEGDPKRFQRWMEEQRKLGRDVYGNPEQGYAGAYL